MVLSFVSASSLAGAPGDPPHTISFHSIVRGPRVKSSRFASVSSLGAPGVLFRFVGFNFLAAPGRALPAKWNPRWRGREQSVGEAPSIAGNRTKACLLPLGGWAHNET